MRKSRKTLFRMGIFKIKPPAYETTSKTPNYCLILYKLFMFGIAQASLILFSLNHNFQARILKMRQ